MRRERQDGYLYYASLVFRFRLPPTIWRVCWFYYSFSKCSPPSLPRWCLFYYLRFSPIKILDAHFRFSFQYFQLSAYCKRAHTNQMPLRNPIELKSNQKKPTVNHRKEKKSKMKRMFLYHFSYAFIQLKKA